MKRLIYSTTGARKNRHSIKASTEIREVKRSEILDAVNNIFYYLNSRLVEDELSEQEFKLVDYEFDFELGDDDRIYSFTLEDSDGNRYTDTIRLLYNSASDTWYDYGEAADVSDELASIYEDYLDTIS